MPTLPQLIEEDVQQLDETLREFNAQTDATTSLIIDKGGFLLAHQGDDSQFDLTTIGALASGAFMANQTIAGLVNEKTFDSIYQQGEKFSMFVINVDEHCLLAVIFESRAGVGVVKFYSAFAVKRIAKQLVRAQERSPGAGLDLSELNATNPQDFFKKKADDSARPKIPTRVGTDIHFECHACRQPIEINADGAGREFACPNCSEPLVVPNQPA
jgi:predicted regulator of Ras-like GTPase activity (Roadblock/LC7/MglB family)